MIWRNSFTERVNFSFFHTVHCTKFLYHLFIEKCPGNGYFTKKDFTVKFILRNKSQVIQQYLKLRTVRCTLRKNEKFTLLTKIFFHQINSLVIYFVNVLLSRNLLSHLFGKISWKQRFSKFSTLCVYLYTLVGITYVCTGLQSLMCTFFRE